MISNQELEDLIQKYLPIYENSEPISARRISHALPKWRKTKTDWLAWWKDQKLDLRIDLQKFLFWLVTQEKFSIDIFGEIHDKLTPLQANSKTIPVSLLESGGTPKFDGGIVSQEWELCNYVFKRTNELGRWNIVFDGQPSDKTPNVDLDLVLSAISFEIRRLQNIAKIGFAVHNFQSSTSTQRETVHVGLAVTIHQLPPIDYKQVEELIELSKQSSSNGLSVEELLRVRHRAIVDSSNESKLITLWGTVEIEFGDDEKTKKLLSDEEISKIKDFLKSKLKETSREEKVINAISKLKQETKNEVIREEISKLNCSRDKNLGSEVQQITQMRGQLAHGRAIDESQKLELLRHVTFLFAVIDETIENKIKEIVKSQSS